MCRSSLLLFSACSALCTLCFADAQPSASDNPIPPRAGPPQPIALKPGLRTLPPVVFCPDMENKGQNPRVLFENPGQWAETRKRINVFCWSDSMFNPGVYTDEELRAWFKLLKEWGIALELDCGAIKEWGVTGKGTFEKQRRQWDRVVSLGGRIDYISMDEPLVCIREHMKPRRPDDYAVEETANFIAEVRAHFPETKIIEIEGYPSVPVKDHLWWIDELEKKLAEKGLRGLDGYRLDANWVVPLFRNEGSWQEVAQIQEFCRGRNIPFSLIYWAPNYPVLKQIGLASDKIWYISTMQQGYDYAAVTQSPFSAAAKAIVKNDYGRGPGPDQYVIQSWVRPNMPVIPESAPFSFTRAALDFVDTFVKEPQPAKEPAK